MDKPEDIVLWEFNICDAIDSVADIEFQRKVWLGLDLRYCSSFHEVIMILYDDCCFEDYIVYRKQTYGIDILWVLMCDLDKLMSAYDPDNVYTDKFVLTDPEWWKITLLAKAVLEEMKRYV